MPLQKKNKIDACIKAATSHFLAECVLCAVLAFEEGLMELQKPRKMAKCPMKRVLSHNAKKAKIGKYINAMENIFCCRYRA